MATVELTADGTRVTSFAELESLVLRIAGARDGISTCGPAVAVGLIAAEETVA